jgi:phosphoribosylamine--glycine ligase
VLASNGYPGKYDTGFEITGYDKADAEVYFAGAKADGEKILTGGGRVLAVSSTGKSLKDAVDASYREAAKINFENKYFRNDIGARALKCVK